MHCHEGALLQNCALLLLPACHVASSRANAWADSKRTSVAAASGLRARQCSRDQCVVQRRRAAADQLPELLIQRSAQELALKGVRFRIRRHLEMDEPIVAIQADGDCEP